MAKTALSDVIIPEIFNKYLIEQTSLKMAFIRSGIVRQDSVINSLVAGGGQQFNMPFFQSIVGKTSSNVLSESVPLGVNNITAEKQIARRLERGDAWSSNDLVKINAGADPMAAIGSQIADYWAHDMENVLLAQLKGVFANNEAADSSDLIYDIATGDGENAGDSNKMSGEAIIAASALLGDSASKVSALAMHSVVYTRLQQLNLIDFTPTNIQNIGFGTYLGKSIVVNDNMPVIAGDTSGYKYVTYLFKPGSVLFGESYGDLITEVDRDILQADDVLASRRIFCFHPAGFQYIEGSIAGNSPSNAELDDAARWDRVFEKKNTGIVRMVTN